MNLKELIRMNFATAHSVAGGAPDSPKFLAAKGQEYLIFAMADLQAEYQKIDEDRQYRDEIKVGKKTALARERLAKVKEDFEARFLAPIRGKLNTSRQRLADATGPKDQSDADRILKELRVQDLRRYALQRDNLELFALLQQAIADIDDLLFHAIRDASPFLLAGKSILPEALAAADRQWWAATVDAKLVGAVEEAEHAVGVAEKNLEETTIAIADYGGIQDRQVSFVKV